MATYQQIKEDDTNNLGTTVAPGGGQSAVISGQGASPSSSLTGAPKSPSNPGNFVGLQTYLDANKTQSAEMGQKVAGEVGGSISKAQTYIGGLGAQMQGAVSKNALSGLDTAGQEATSAAQKTAGGTSTDADKARFGQVATAKYTGPETLTQANLYQPAATDIATAQTRAEQTKTEEGQGGLLRDVYKAPDYSSGENRLDTYLLKNKPTQEALATARTGAEGLTGQLSEADKNAAAYAAGIKQKTAEAAKTAQTGLETARTGLSTQVEDRLNKVSSTWKDEYNKYVDALKIGNLNGLSPGQLSELGLSQGQALFNTLNPTSPEDLEKLHLSQETFDKNKSVSKDEQARLSALDELAKTYGGSQTNLYNDPSLAGTGSNKIRSTLGKAATDAQKSFESDAQNRTFGGNYQIHNPSGGKNETVQVNLADFLKNGPSAIKMSDSTPDPSKDATWATDRQNAVNEVVAKINDYLTKSGYPNVAGEATASSPRLIGQTNAPVAAPVAYEKAPGIVVPNAPALINPLTPIQGAIDMVSNAGGGKTTPTSIPGIALPNIPVPKAPTIKLPNFKW